MNLQYRPVRREERGMFILHHLIDVYALFSDVSLRRQASMTQAEKFPDPFCSRAMLICSTNHLVRKAMLRAVVGGLFFVDMRLPRIQCR